MPLLLWRAKERMDGNIVSMLKPLLDIENTNAVLEDRVGGFFAAVDLVFSGFCPTPTALVVYQDTALQIAKASRRKDGMTFVEKRLQQTSTMALEFKKGGASRKKVNHAACIYTQVHCK
jgi:hypothetical protein